MRYHDGEPSLVEGLLSRGDRRVGAVIEQVWRDGGRFDGWTEHFSFDRWVGGRASRRRRRPRLVHDPRARRRRGAALGPPRLRPGQAVALGRLAGRARRVRAGRLPLDAVLRLRRLLEPGHRHPDRAPTALLPWSPCLAARRSAHRCRPATRECDSPVATTLSAVARRWQPDRARPPPPVVQRVRHPLRQARPAALHLAPRLRPRLRAGAAPGRGADGATRPGSPRTRRSATSGRRRPASAARPSTSRSGWPARSIPRQLRAALDAALPDGLDIVEAVVGRPRIAGRADARPRAGGSSCPGVDPDDVAGRGRRRSWPRDEVGGRAADQERPARRSTSARRSRRGSATSSGAAADRPGRGTCDTGPGRPAGDPRRTTRRCRCCTARRRRSRPGRAARRGAPGAGTARRRRCGRRPTGR